MSVSCGLRRECFEKCYWNLLGRVGSGHRNLTRVQLCGYPKSGVSHWLWMSLLQQCFALTCYTVILAYIWFYCTVHRALQSACVSLLQCTLPENVQFSICTQSSLASRQTRCVSTSVVDWQEPYQVQLDKSYQVTAATRRLLIRTLRRFCFKWR